MSGTKDLAEVVRTARAELAARPLGTRIDSVAARHTDITLDDAYVVQQALVDGSSSTRPAGFKIALGSPAAQEAFGLDGPATGALIAERCLPSGATVVLSDLVQPVLEVELAVELTDTLLERVVVLTGEDVVRLGRLRASFEIVERRITPVASPTQALDFVMDNAAFGHAVIGEDELLGVPPDLDGLTVVLRKDGVVQAELAVDAGPHGPMATTAAVLRSLAARDTGSAVGDLCLSGTVVPAVSLARGTYVAGFSCAGAPLGAVELVVA
jgi:2-keto-4-pentenoate hydratase